MCKKLLSVFLVLGLLCSLLACTAEQTPAGTSGEALSTPVTVTDMIGREVTVTPGSYKRVVCIGAGALRMYCYVGDVALLCGVEDIDNTALETRPQMFDSVARPYVLAYGDTFQTLPSCGVGGPIAQAAEAEKILACEPDIVISEFEDVDKSDALQEQLGVPVITLSAGSDGVFDEKDRDARFDFHYGILTTRQAFSCGNLFPIVMREEGAAVIGEKTSGGSCCVQFGMDSLGLRWLMSSAQWQLLDRDGESVEGGCTVDMPIKARSIGIVDSLLGYLGVDEGLPIFTDLYVDQYLDLLMNTWFHTSAEQEPAA